MISHHGPAHLTARFTTIINYSYIVEQVKASLWHSPILPPPVVKIPRDQPKKGTDGYGGKDIEKRKVLR